MPDRLALVKGPPAGRRAHLDGFCAALWPTRAETRRRYARALAQRNALLGRIRAGLADAGSLEAWDLELAEAGVELTADRREAVGRLAPAFEQAATSLGLELDPAIDYRPRSDASTAAELVAELAERRDADIARGYTGWGPHHDELALLHAGGRSLRRYGSQGQQRTALLALLFAERRVLLDDGRPAPLMLLDDVTSELDAGHRELLVEHLERRRPGADHGDRAGAVAALEPASRGSDPGRPSVDRDRDRRPLGGGVTRRAQPRALGEAIRAVRSEAEPATTLAAVQGAWASAVGERIADEARPVRERDAVVTVSCRAATWAQELDLLQDELVERLNRALDPARIERLRFIVGEELDADTL